jgi:hypothetical protein
LLTFGLNLRCTWYVVDSDCGLKVVTHLILLDGMIDLEKVESIILRNVSIHLQDYMSSKPRTFPPSQAQHLPYNPITQHPQSVIFL